MQYNDINQNSDKELMVNNIHDAIPNNTDYKTNKNNNISNTTNSHNNKIFNIDLHNINNEQLNNCTSILYQNIYNSNINTFDTDDFIKNNMPQNFNVSDQDYNNKIFLLYRTHTLDSLRSFDCTNVNFVSLNNITDINQNYEYITYIANVTYHIIQYPQSFGSQIHEFDIQKNDIIKISSDGKIISLISNAI